MLSVTVPCGNGAWDVPSMRGEIAGTAFSTLLPLRWDQYVLRYATETERERERENISTAWKRGACRGREEVYCGLRVDGTILPKGGL